MDSHLPICERCGADSRNQKELASHVRALRHACLAALGFLGDVSCLSKEQLQNCLVEAIKETE